MTAAPLDRSVRIGAVATAVPPLRLDQAEAGALLGTAYAGSLAHSSLELLRKVFAHPSIRTRHLATTSPQEILEETPDARSERYTRWAVELGSDALGRALERAGVAQSELSALVVNTCTGYLCPGVSTYILERLGLPGSLRLLDLVGAGCGGAMPNLQTGEQFVRSTGRPVACVSVEVCTAAFRIGDDASLIVSNALFGDGAAAVVLLPGESGPVLVDWESLHRPEHRDEVRFTYRDGQLYNRITRRLPDLVRQAASTVLDPLLERNGLQGADVAHWALHPGGDRILSSLGRELGLSREQLAPSRAVLARYGNLSSASVGFVLQDILHNGTSPGQWCVLLSYGAGLSAHAALLRL